MSVQTQVNLYQNSKGLGVVGQNNPYDIGAFIAGAEGIKWGVFVKRSANGSKEVEPLSTQTDVLIGATVKQLDRVSEEIGGIFPGSTLNSAIQFQIAVGKPCAVLRMGYLNVSVEGSWLSGQQPLSVRIAPETGGSEIVGAVSMTAASAQTTPGNWAVLPTDTFVFSDSYADVGQQIGELYFDLRVPLATTAP